MQSHHPKSPSTTGMISSALVRPEQPKTLAEKLDAAYKRYLDADKALKNVPESQYYEINSLEMVKTSAVNFMRTVLDVKTKEEALKRMQSRQANSKEEKYERTPLKPTEPYTENLKAKFLWRKLSLFMQLKTLSVNLLSLSQDESNNRQFLTSQEEREPLRVIISDGKFMQIEGDEKLKLFDTTYLQSHNKSRIGSFVINTNYELYVFSHRDGVDGMVHSSIMAQADVFSAGEIQIINGKFKAITPHSGHYLPSMVTLYETLKFFKNCGVDVDGGAVLLFRDDKLQGLKATPFQYYVNGERNERFVHCKVLDFLKYMEVHGKALKMLERMDKYHEKQFSQLLDIFFRLHIDELSSGDAVALAGDCIDDFIQIYQLPRGKFSQYEALENKLVSVAEKYKAEMLAHLQTKNDPTNEATISKLSAMPVNRSHYLSLFAHLNDTKKEVSTQTELHPIPSIKL